MGEDAGSIRLCDSDPAWPAAFAREAGRIRLAKRHWRDVQDYADAKTGCVQAILAKARAEK